MKKIKSGLYEQTVGGVVYRIQFFPKRCSDVGASRDYWTVTEQTDDPEAQYFDTKQQSAGYLTGLTRLEIHDARGKENNGSPATPPTY